eukprot:TRINITY_DN28036_c0_g1_i2.p1 TRINITY_DN28036_c0_g1~~TRINITY_DN28036_c0_g1_i2.p1  ORF type:complete len:267 (+),score=27.37 TRINITY_DN28036_c0_g1_i2:30-830(+)
MAVLLKESPVDASLKKHGVPTPIHVSIMFHLGNDAKEIASDTITGEVDFNNSFGLRYHLRRHFSISAGCGGDICRTVDACRSCLKQLVRSKTFILTRIRRYLSAVDVIRDFITALVTAKRKLFTDIRNYWDREEAKQRNKLRQRLINSREQGLSTEVRVCLHQLGKYSARDHIKKVTIRKLYATQRALHRIRLNTWFTSYTAAKNKIASLREELSQLSDMAWRQQGYKAALHKKEISLKQSLVELEQMVFSKPRFIMKPGVNTSLS